MILDFLKDINNSYANVGLLILGIISAFYIYLQYEASTRPYIIPRIMVDTTTDNWQFLVLLKNKGEKPGVAHIKEALLKIGDEKYPTIFEQNLILTPGEEEKLSPIGYINNIGRNKIKGHEYQNNRVEISLIIESRSLRDKRFNYITEVIYNIDVTQNPPALTLIKDEMF